MYEADTLEPINAQIGGYERLFQRRTLLQLVVKGDRRALVPCLFWICPNCSVWSVNFNILVVFIIS